MDEHLTKLLIALFSLLYFKQSEAIQVAHMKKTQQIIQFMKESDLHSNQDGTEKNDTKQQPQASYGRRETKSSTQPMNYSTSGNDSRWASTSGTASGAGGSSNNLFNKIYNSGR